MLLAEIFITITSVAIGTAGLAAGVGGHLWGNLNWVQRFLALAGSLVLIFSQSLMYMGGGVAVLVIVFLWQWLKGIKGAALNNKAS